MNAGILSEYFPAFAIGHHPGRLWFGFQYWFPAQMSPAEAGESDAHSIRVVEPQLTRDVTDALGEMGFGLSAGGWVKPIVKGFHELSSALQHLEDVGLTLDEPPRTAINQPGTMNWPGKPVAEEMNAYLIPIQSQWAEHFFDSGSANQRFPSLSGITQASSQASRKSFAENGSRDPECKKKPSSTTSKIAPRHTESSSAELGSSKPPRNSKRVRPQKRRIPPASVVSVCWERGVGEADGLILPRIRYQLGVL